MNNDILVSRIGKLFLELRMTLVKTLESCAVLSHPTTTYLNIMSKL